MNKSMKITILGIIIALLLITLGLVYPVRADIGNSVFDGEWTIVFTDCAGVVATYYDCKVSDLNENWVTFTQGGRGQELMLPLLNVCATVVLKRER